MSLRDENPFIDSDLELIITAFEQVMVKSEDSDSVLVPFKRQLVALSNYPRSVISSIDAVPLNVTGEESTGEPSKTSTPTVQTPINAVVSPETVTGDPNTPTEDGDDDEWADKVSDWVTECIPCTGDFKRTISSMNAEFFKEIGEGWDKALEETWDKLTDFEDFLFDSDEDILGAFCDLGGALKDHCGPDIKKMIFILSMMLSKMQREFSLDLGILDSFLMSALSPLFNELAANLDLIGELAIKPIRCVLDYIQYQINNAPRLAEEARAAALDPVKEEAYKARLAIDAAIRRNRARQQEDVISPRSSNHRSEAEIAAERARLEEQKRQLQQRNKERFKSALDRANNAMNSTKDSLNFLDKFKGYLKEGTDYLENKKSWLLSLIEEFINSGLDKWNDQMIFARGKTDILTMISIMKAMVEAAQSGDISCGSESGGLTTDDVAKIVKYWRHPSESLEIIVEDGNIITRRRPDIPSNAQSDDASTDDVTGETGEGDRGIITGADGPDSTSEVLSNIVVRRSISSCLKKVTTDEAEQVSHWIRQLEQEV